MIKRKWHDGWIAFLLVGLAVLVGFGAATPAVMATGNVHVPAAEAATSTGAATAGACEYWVAPPPLGNDSNPGTSDRPWATLKYASENVPDNLCTVWFSEGTYFGYNRLTRRFATPTTFRSILPYRAIFENTGPPVAISGGRNMTLEGFRFRHAGPGATALVVVVDGSDKGWAELITFRNNIFHDSYNNDLLKIRNGARFVTVEGNVFYNQGENEQHMDVNSVTDVVIRDNIFFNDFEGSGRAPYYTKHYIVIKDSSEGADGLYGSERVVVQRNVFLNWQGPSGETFLQVGNDGKPYHEAKDVRVENNLMVGNTANPTRAVLGVTGARDVAFVNNTVTGDLPASGYALRASIKDLNPQNQNVYFYNNVWSDPTGTMDEFSDGKPSATSNLVLDNNLYWNGGRTIPSGEVVSPLIDDSRRVVANPLLSPDQAPVVLPRWDGSAFTSGNTSIRQEFLRLVGLYGAIPADSPAIGKADPAFAPDDDILGRLRGSTRDLGAYEAQATTIETPVTTATPTQVATETPTSTATPIQTSTPTPSWTATMTPTATPSATPTPTAGTPSDSYHVGDLDAGSTKLRQGRWEASVRITVHGTNEAVVPNVTVHGQFSQGGWSSTVSCTTDGSGRCVVHSGELPSAAGSADFRVTGMDPSLDYNPSANHDPDGDSDGTAVDISKGGGALAASLSAGQAANVSEQRTSSDHASDVGLLQTLVRLVERGLNHVFGGPISVAAVAL